jgi:hypothetical protein
MLFKSYTLGFIKIDYEFKKSVSFLNLIDSYIRSIESTYTSLTLTIVGINSLENLFLPLIKKNLMPFLISIETDLYAM